MHLSGQSYGTLLRDACSIRFQYLSAVSDMFITQTIYNVSEPVFSGKTAWPAETTDWRRTCIKTTKSRLHLYPLCSPGAVAHAFGQDRGEIGRNRFWLFPVRGR